MKVMSAASLQNVIAVQKEVKVLEMLLHEKKSS
jgi:hypothetical protein